jgi:hypothetical protein
MMFLKGMKETETVDRNFIVRIAINYSFHEVAIH